MHPGKLLIASLCTLASLGAQAQRHCDMAVTLVSPSAGSVINAFAQFTVTVSIVNNGPDDLLVGDTLYYNTPSMPSINTAPYVLQQAILSGNSAAVTLSTQTNINGNNDDVTANYCVKVWSSPANNGAFADTLKANNSSCNSVTFKGSGTGINSIDGSNEALNLYPNPASGLIGFDVNATALKKVVVQIRDLSGRTVCTKELGNIAAGTKNVQVNVGDLVPGLYLIELQSEQGRFSGKFVKQ